MEWQTKISTVLFESLAPKDKHYLLEAKATIQENYAAHFVRIFSSLNRRLSKESKNQVFHINDPADLPLIIENWSTIRLTRVWLIGLIDDEKKPYHAFVDRLFEYAEMEELVALYSALNILQYPALWVSRCQEGIRSNIGDVQQAIMEQNRYPAAYLSNESWNQLVLKSFFTEKDILKIVGLFERNNVDLAHAIIDYIYERHAAKRSIHPILWLLSKDYLPERAWGILNERRVATDEQFERSLLGQIWTERRHILSRNHTDKNAAITSPEIARDLLEKLKNEKICAQN